MENEKEIPQNLLLWESLREVPKSAQKPINGGRLKGMTDINPIWRIKALTEQFGPVGFGWYYEIKDQRIVEGANGEQVAFVDLLLYVKNAVEWSRPIPGIGGSSFIAKEAKGLYTNDECFKMALTDAISVACKALGIGADIYWSGDAGNQSTPQTKYEGIKDEMMTDDESNILLAIKMCSTLDELNGVYSKAVAVFKDQTVLIEACKQRKKEIQ